MLREYGPQNQNELNKDEPIVVELTDQSGFNESRGKFHIEEKDTVQGDRKPQTNGNDDLELL
jgi:hypothetical protein